jgi:hypothetical protein
MNESALNTHHLAKHNLIIDEESAKLTQKYFDIDWEIIEKNFNLSKITIELPMCIESAKFRIELSLNSSSPKTMRITNAVIINDVSTEGTGEIYNKYF